MTDFKDYKILYGLPHCHSSFSIGSEDPIKILDSARNSGLDFVLLSDCNSFLSKETKYKSSKITKWDALQKICKNFNKKYRDFLALFGFEASSPYYGHFNITGSKIFFSSSIKKFDMFLIWLWLNPSIIFINNPHTLYKSIPPSDFIKNRICLIDVGNGNFNSEYSRYEKNYYSMLDCGWKIGAINSQNDFKKSHGISDNLTAVMCPDYSLQSLISSLYAKRTYSTESKTLRMYFSVNKSIMGESIEISEGEYLNFNIKAYDTSNPIEKIEIISSGSRIIRSETFPGQKKISYILRLKASEHEKWYVVKLTQKNNRIAISSPIFINIKGNTF